MTVKIRYKLPGESESKFISFPVGTSSIRKAGQESLEFRFAASVAGFGMLLRDSPYKGSADYDGVINMAQAAIGPDAWGFRRGFVDLVKSAKNVKQK